MRRSSLFGHVVEVLARISGTQLPADAVLQEFVRSRHYLGARDRRMITETVFDCLRHDRYLSFVVREALARLDDASEETRRSPFALLAAHALIIRREDPATLIPDLDSLWQAHVRSHALDRFAEALRFAEAGLRLPEDSAERLALLHSLPVFLVRDWMEQFGEEEAAGLCSASNIPGSIAVRVNTLRCTPGECQEALQREGVTAVPSKVSTVGLVLGGRVNTQALRTFREGWFEMQEEGSQVLSLLVDARPGMSIVDACAGGGGKSLHLAAIMGNEGRLIAADISAARLARLDERARRAGATMIASMASDDPRMQEWEGRADAVLVDAPCSGSGTLRRNPGAKRQLTEERVGALVQTQARLLERHAALVRPGGRLVYTTCSLLRCENDQQVERFLAVRGDFRRVPASSLPVVCGLGAGDTTVLLRPDRHGTDGFFGAILERVAN